MRASVLARGVSLLEVIVALVVLSTFGATLFVWAGQTTRTANRAIEWMDQLRLEANVDALAQSLNPSSVASGQARTPEFRYEWQALPLRAPVPHVKHPYGVSPFEVALFRVRIRVFAQNGGDPLLETERVVAGYKQVHPFSSGPPGASLDPPGVSPTEP